MHAERSRVGSTYQLGDVDKLFWASTSWSVKWVILSSTTQSLCNTYESAGCLVEVATLVIQWTQVKPLLPGNRSGAFKQADLMERSRERSLTVCEDGGKGSLWEKTQAERWGKFTGMRSQVKIPWIQEDQAKKEELPGFFITTCNKHMKSQDRLLPHFTLGSSAGLETKIPRKVDAKGSKLCASNKGHCTVFKQWLTIWTNK